MFTSIIRAIIGSKFQIDPITVTLFSGSRPKKPPPPPVVAKSQNAVGYGIKAMFTLYRIGFCSVSRVAPVQCEQELMFCCGAEIVPKRSQCEQKPYPLCNLQRSLSISKDHLPKRGSVAISAPIKVFRLDWDGFKNLSDTERSTFNSGAEQYCSEAETASKAAFLV